MTEQPSLQGGISSFAMEREAHQATRRELAKEQETRREAQRILANVRQACQDQAQTILDLQARVRDLIQAQDLWTGKVAELTADNIRLTAELANARDQVSHLLGVMALGAAL